MHISEHYPALVKSTLLVLTNNELAKLYSGHERELTELEVLTAKEGEPVERLTGTNLPSAGDADASKLRRRDEFYSALSARLQELLKKDDYREIILCVPEANKNDLSQALHPDVKKRVKSLVPKNLASMELAQVVRILFEA